MLRVKRERLGKFKRHADVQPDNERPDEFADYEQERLSVRNTSGGILNHAVTIIIGVIILLIFLTNHYKTDVYGLVEMFYQQATKILSEPKSNNQLVGTEDSKITNTESIENQIPNTPAISQSELIQELESQNNNDTVETSNDLISEPSVSTPSSVISKPRQNAMSSKPKLDDKKLAGFTQWYYIFDEEFSGSKWDLRAPITWAIVPEGTSYSVAYGETKRISNAKQDQVKAIRQAFESWNSAVSEKLFIESRDWTRAEVIVGVPTDWETVKSEYTKGGNKEVNPAGLWHAKHQNRTRISGSIELRAELSVDLFRTVAVHEIGNILGLGDVSLSPFKSTQSQYGKHRFKYASPQPIDIAWLQILYHQHFKGVPMSPLINAEVQGAMKKMFKKSNVEYPSSCTRFTNQTLEFEIKLSESGKVSTVTIEKSAMCNRYAEEIANALVSVPTIEIFKSLTPAQYNEANTFKVAFYSGHRKSLAR